MKKIDFKKEFGRLYFPSATEVVVVDVPAMNFAMVQGAGNPNTTPAFQEAIEALYGVSYTLRFGLKKQGVAEYRVGPLESLWWTDESGGFSMDSKEEWNWTSMIMQPEVVTPSPFPGRRLAVEGEEESGRLAERALGALPRRPVRPSDAHRPLFRGEADHRADSQFHTGTQI